MMSGALDQLGLGFGTAGVFLGGNGAGGEPSSSSGMGGGGASGGVDFGHGQSFDAHLSGSSGMMGGRGGADGGAAMDPDFGGMDPANMASIVRIALLLSSALPSFEA